MTSFLREIIVPSGENEGSDKNILFHIWILSISKKIYNSYDPGCLAVTLFQEYLRKESGTPPEDLFIISASCLMISGKIRGHLDNLFHILQEMPPVLSTSKRIIEYEKKIIYSFDGFLHFPTPLDFLMEAGTLTEKDISYVVLAMSNPQVVSKYKISVITDACSILAHPDVKSSLFPETEMCRSDILSFKVPEVHRKNDPLIEQNEKLLQSTLSPNKIECETVLKAPETLTFSGKRKVFCEPVDEKLVLLNPSDCRGIIYESMDGQVVKKMKVTEGFGLLWTSEISTMKFLSETKEADKFFARLEKVTLDSHLVQLKMKKYKCDLFTEIEYLYPPRNRERPQILPPGRIIRYTKQILECLIRLHSLGFAHLDVKSENIFLDENDHVVLGDFGLSSPIFVYSKIRGRGTKDWQPPEMIDPSLPIDFAKVDIWSLGMTIIEMMRGNALVHPGGQACRVAYCRNIPTLVQRLAYPANLIKFTQSLFEFDISKRPTAKQALQMMYDLQLLSPAAQK